MHAMASGSFVQQMLAWMILRWPIMSDPSTCKTVPLPVITHQSRPLYFSLIASDPNFPLLQSLLLCWQQRGIKNGDAAFKEAYVFSSKIGRWRNLEARLKTPPSLSMLIISLDVTVYVNGYGCRLATLFHFSSLRFCCFGLWCWEWGRRVPGLPTLGLWYSWQILDEHNTGCGGGLPASLHSCWPSKGEHMEARWGWIRLSPQDLVAQNSHERTRWDSYWENALDILCRPDLYPCLPWAASGTLGFLLLWGSMFVLPWFERRPQAWMHGQCRARTAR